MDSKDIGLGRYIWGEWAQESYIINFVLMTLIFLNFLIQSLYYWFVNTIGPPVTYSVICLLILEYDLLYLKKVIKNKK